MLRPFNSLFFAWWYQLMLLLPPSMPAGASFTLNPHSDTHLTIWNAHHLSDCKFTTYTFNSPHKQSHWTEVSLIGGLSSIKKNPVTVSNIVNIFDGLCIQQVAKKKKKTITTDIDFLSSEMTRRLSALIATRRHFLFALDVVACRVMYDVASCRL